MVREVRGSAPANQNGASGASGALTSPFLAADTALETSSPMQSSSFFTCGTLLLTWCAVLWIVLGWVRVLAGCYRLRRMRRNHQR